MEEKPVVQENPVVEEDVSVVEETKEDVEIKESVDEYQKDERFELEDSEVEYEHEEYVGVDYDLKDIDQEEAHELGDEVEEKHDEVNEGQEDEGDMVGEEIEDDPEELEGEGSEELDSDEHEHVHERAEMVDVDEEDRREVFNERRKCKEFEVFVGGLDMDATEDDLRKAFSEIGEVTEVRLMMNTQTKKNKGFAFLRFATVEQAKRAVLTLQNPVIKGKQCGVTPSTRQDTDTLFLSNICKTWRKEALEEKLKHYGVGNVVDLTLVEDRNSEGMNRGFAFLEFSSRSDAMDVYKRLQNIDVVFGDDRPGKVSFADSFIDPNDEIMAQVKTLFVDGIPDLWDEDRVRELLEKYGEIEKIELSRHMPLAKRKDFGFVTFNSHDAAVTCAKSINNAELGEGDSKAKVSARLSRPLPRVKGKNNNYVDHRSGRGVGPVGRVSWDRPAPRRFPVRGVRGRGRRFPLPPVSMKMPFGLRERRPAVSMPARSRLLAPLQSYGRRAPAPPYPKNSFKREHGWRDDIAPPRNRPVANYGSRLVRGAGRWQSNRGGYSFHASAYSDMHRIPSQTVPRRAYANDSYDRRFERPPPSYQEPQSHNRDSISGSKRPYAALDDVPPRYADAGIRQSRTHLDYRYANARGPSQYGDSYGDRFGRSNVGYGSSRSSTFNHDSHGRNSSSRQGMGYGRGSFGGSDVSSMYSSSYGGNYMSRESDVGGSSYSSWYSSHDAGGNSYMGNGSSRSYY